MTFRFIDLDWFRPNLITACSMSVLSVHRMIVKQKVIRLQPALMAVGSWFA
jgi:hypothetical protein